MDALTKSLESEGSDRIKRQEYGNFPEVEAKFKAAEKKYTAIALADIDRIRQFVLSAESNWTSVTGWRSSVR